MSPDYQLEILEKLYSREFLYEVGTRNDIIWDTGEEDSETWNNFKESLIVFLEDNILDLDFTEESDIREIIDNYTSLRELHKKYMVPQVRAVMQKIKEESGDNTPNNETLLEKAYEQLSLYGGVGWNNKLNTLHYYSQRIRELSEQIEVEE